MQTLFWINYIIVLFLLMCVWNIWLRLYDPISISLIAPSLQISKYGSFCERLGNFNYSYNDVLNENYSVIKIKIKISNSFNLSIFIAVKKQNLKYLLSLFLFVNCNILQQVVLNCILQIFHRTIAFNQTIRNIKVIVIFLMIFLKAWTNSNFLGSTFKKKRNLRWKL